MLLAGLPEVVTSTDGRTVLTGTSRFGCSEPPPLMLPEPEQHTMHMRAFNGSVPMFLLTKALWSISLRRGYHDQRRCVHSLRTCCCGGPGDPDTDGDAVALSVIDFVVGVHRPLVCQGISQ